MIEADRTQLKGEVRSVVRKLNGRRNIFGDGNPYEAKVGEYHDGGVAIDIIKDGEPPSKVTGHFGRAALRAGYVVVGVYVPSGDYTVHHTRLFLQEASEHFDAERERAEGFLAGMLFASMMENTAQEPMERDEAKEYLIKNNDFRGGTVVVGKGDVVGELYTNDHRDIDVDQLDLPPGWLAVEDQEGWSFVQE